MTMELIKKENEEIVFVEDMDISLANAIRRSVGEIPILAIFEADIYKNDSALYDEIISHRLGLVPLKNQKLKSGDSFELKLNVKTKNGERKEVLSGDLGNDIVYPEMPIVLLENGQELKLVARANVGLGIEHSRYFPGLLYYKHLPKIKISPEGEKHTELAEIYGNVFEVDGNGKLKVKSNVFCALDSEDFDKYKGIEVSFSDDKLAFFIESWGQIEPSDIYKEACKALKSNLSKVLKAIK